MPEDFLCLQNVRLVLRAGKLGRNEAEDDPVELLCLLIMIRLILRSYLVASERVEGIIGGFKVHRFLRVVPNKPGVHEGFLG